MPKAYSEDMRARVIAEVESGASRRAVAEEFDVSASTAIIWVKCFRETGRCTAKPRGGSVSPLEKHADFLLGLIARTWLRSLNHQQCTTHWEGRLRGLRGRRSLPGPVSDPARSRCGDHHDAAVGRGALDLTVSNVVHPPSIHRQHLRSNPT
jgi:transposase-like protein